MSGDDFIIPGGTGPVQVLSSGNRESVQSLSRAVGSQQAATDQELEGVQSPSKPFLEFLLSAESLDREELRLLRKKVGELRAKEVEENLVVLRGESDRLAEALEVANREATSEQVENIMVTLANNYSRDEISQIFGSEDADELINKLNEALCLEE